MVNDRFEFEALGLLQLTGVDNTLGLQQGLTDGGLAADQQLAAQAQAFGNIDRGFAAYDHVHAVFGSLGDGRTHLFGLAAAGVDAQIRAQQGADGGQLLVQLRVSYKAQAWMLLGRFGRRLVQDIDQVAHADGQKHHRNLNARFNDLIGGPAAHHNNLRPLLFSLTGYVQRTAEASEVQTDFVLQAQFNGNPLGYLVAGAFRSDDDNRGHGFLVWCYENYRWRRANAQDGGGR